MEKLNTSNERSFTQFFSPEIPNYLPPHKMYKIQIGGEVFLLSGASISSDGPNSYFLEFFQNIEESETNESEKDFTNDRAKINVDVQERVLFIDRDPEIFRYIYNHLQGYFINIPDEIVFTKIFADAMYYRLPRLRKLLKETDFYYVNIGGQSFKISKNLFNEEGNSKNYFKITAEMIYQDIESLFLSNKNKNFLRPPPQMWTHCARSPKLFAQILDLLNNGKFEGTMAERHNLIKECRFYRLLRLEQQLIAYKFFTNPLNNATEIFLNLLDVKTNDKNIGLIDFDFEKTNNTQSNNNNGNNSSSGSDDSGESLGKKRKLNFERQLQEITIDDICNKRSGSKDTVFLSDSETSASFKNPIDCAIWSAISYSRPHVDAWKYPLVFQIGNAVHEDEKLKSVDHCFVNTVKTLDEQGNSIAKPKSSMFLADPDCMVNYGSLIFDQEKGCCYISFEGLIAVKLYKLLQLLLDETIIQANYVFNYIDTNKQSVSRIILPCCVKFTVPTIDNKPIKNLCGLLREKMFLKNLEKCRIDSTVSGNIINGYKIPLCDRSVWRLGFKSGKNNAKSKDQVMMIAIKLRCGSVKEYNNYF